MASSTSPGPAPAAAPGPASTSATILRQFFGTDPPPAIRLPISDGNWIQLYDNGQYRDAIVSCKKCLETTAIHAASDHELETMSNALEYACRSLDRLGALQDAKQLLAAYSQLVERFTNLSLLQAALLDSSQGQMLHLESLMHSSNTLSASGQPGFDELNHVRHADTLLRIGQVERAQQYLESIPNPSLNESVQHAICLIRLNQFSTAIQKLNRVLRQDPRHYSAALNLACALIYTGQGLQSVQLLENCIRADPGQALRQPFFVHTLNSIYELVSNDASAEQETLACLVAEFCPDLPLPPALNFS